MDAMPSRPHGLIGLVVLAALCGLTTSAAARECQEFSSTRGVISTPNFPNRFEVPLRACYVIARRSNESKEEKWKTVIYFTQYLMTSGVSIEGYTRFEGLNSPLNEGRVLSSQPIATERPTELVIDSAAFVAIIVDVDHLVGTNIRVPNNLLDVYGFNITYEFIPFNTSTRLELVEKAEAIGHESPDKCLLDQCRYNGWCRGNDDLSGYSCDCFEGFFGENCQYSKRCNLENTGACVHGTCSHHIGGLTSICQCARGYVSPTCDRLERASVCSERRCTAEQTPACTDDVSQDSTRCQCASGNYLRGCECESGWTVDENGACQRPKVEWLQWKIGGVKNHQEIQEKLLQLKSVVNVTLLEAASQRTRFQFTIVRNHSAEVMIQLAEFNFAGSDFVPEDDLVVLKIASNKMMPVHEDIEPLVLSCVFRAPEGARVEWYKESALINTNFGHANLWQDQIPPTGQGIHTSFLGLDHVKYMDKGNFSCVIRHGDEVRRRRFVVSIKMEPTLSITPSSQNVEFGKSMVFTCGLRQHNRNGDVRYKWFKSVNRGGSRSWHQVGSKGSPDDTEYMEHLFPTRARLVITSVKVHTEYQCQRDPPSGIPGKIVYVFPYKNDSAFCPAETYMGVSWNRTAVGAQDVKACTLRQDSPKGEAVRRCLGINNTGYWSEPNFFDCAFEEIYVIRKEILSLARGYQSTTAVNSLRRLASYIKKRGKNLLPGEGNHIMETLHEVLEYDEGLSPDHPEVENRNESVNIFLDCVSDVFSVPRSIRNHQFYEKLHEMIPNFLNRYLSGQPPGTRFQYENDLFVVEAHVSRVPTFDDDHVAVFEANLPSLGISGYTMKTHDSAAPGQVVIILFALKSLAKNYLSKLHWLEKQDKKLLYSRLAYLKVATILKDGSVLRASDENVFINFKLPAIANTSVHCARVVRDGEEVQFSDTEVTEVDVGEFSCKSRGSNLFALYREPIVPTVVVEKVETRVFPIVCAIAAVLLSFSGVLTITCTNSSWSLLKCVKLHVSIALTANFIIAGIEASNQRVSQSLHLETRFLRQTTLLVVFGEQIVVMVTMFAELFQRKFLKTRIQIGKAVAIPWFMTAIIMGIAFGTETATKTNEDSYWGTMESAASLSSAIFIVMIIVSILTYALIAFEIELAVDQRSGFSFTSTQKGMMRRSMAVVAVLTVHALAVSGYFQDETADAITSVLLALTVFFVYTAYCETDAIYHNILAHYKKNHEVKSVSD